MTSNFIWFILILVMLASYLIQNILNSRFDKYSKVPTPGGMTGADVARKMLNDFGIHNVKVEHVSGKLTDHYNPQTRTLNLSDAVYGNASIAAAAVAAHECGHAVQHAWQYGPLQMRSALVPVVSFASKFVSIVLIAGVIFIESFPTLLWIGIALFATTTLFSIITLPVEINASSRAVAWLGKSNIVDAQTKPMATDALKWAAYTYVIAALGSIATLIYYISIANGRRR
ncbi:MAG: zinc metallopeptidase [Bacteroidales bacterium]|nr:zinc metallopeptidase [Candidatus Hennigimonas equi]